MRCETAVLLYNQEFLFLFSRRARLLIPDFCLGCCGATLLGFLPLIRVERKFLTSNITLDSEHCTKTSHYQSPSLIIRNGVVWGRKISKNAKLKSMKINICAQTPRKHLIDSSSVSELMYRSGLRTIEHLSMQLTSVRALSTVSLMCSGESKTQRVQIQFYHISRVRKSLPSINAGGSGRLSAP